MPHKFPLSRHLISSPRHPGLDPGSSAKSVTKQHNVVIASEREAIHNPLATLSPEPGPSWSHLLRPSTPLNRLLKHHRHPDEGLNRRSMPANSRKTIHLLIAFLFLALTPASAQLIDKPLPDTVQENRAQNLFRQLRCMVCQNQSIHDSDAPLALDMRTIVREQVTTGKPDTEILGFLESRYGEFVLMRPRFAPHTWALWLAPLIVLLLGLWAMARLVRRRAQVPEPAPLAEAEKAELEKLKKRG
jgi:cytochrome c-type biogenesis protein CcmH